MEILCERNNATRQKAIDKTEDDNVEHEKVAEEQKLMDDEENLVVLLEQRLQFLLRSLTKLFLSKSPVHNKKEYVALKSIIYFKDWMKIISLFLIILIYSIFN